MAFYYPNCKWPAACGVPQYSYVCYPQNYCNFPGYLSYAYQNQLRKLQRCEVTMEYWTRQLEYFRNLLKNFSADIESPEDLKKLLQACNYDPNVKNCFEKRRTFNQIDKLFCNCHCNACLKRTLMRLCNALSAPWPCSRPNCATCCAKPPCCVNYCQKPPCGVNNCQKQPCGVNYCQKPKPCYYYIPCQTPCQTSCKTPCQPSCQVPYYYYYNCPQPANYCYPPQQSNCCYPQQANCCSGDCGDMCCNKCRFKYIMNKINWLLTSAEKLRNPPCPCTCNCARSCNCSCACPCDKPPCCPIKEIKEETVVVKQDCNDDDNKKSCNKKAPCSKECKPLADSSEDSSDSTNVVACQKPKTCPCTPNVSFNPNCSESTKCYSCTSCTLNDCMNLDDECKNANACKKQVSIALGREYVSPSGNFQVVIENQGNNSCPNMNNNGDYVFEVDYITYTMPKNECNCNDV